MISTHPDVSEFGVVVRLISALRRPDLGRRLEPAARIETERIGVPVAAVSVALGGLGAAREPILPIRKRGTRV